MGDQFELYFSISKFEGNMGYSLTETEVKSDQPILFDAIGGTGDQQADEGKLRGKSNDRKSASPDRKSPDQNETPFKRETIPEFVHVSNIKQIYHIFCDANKKNKILLRSQLGQDYFNSEERRVQLTLQNVKDDIILIQFKLVRRDTGRTHNVQTFANVPTSKQFDINIATLIEIVGKQNQL
jgi:hypothetical protein